MKITHRSGVWVAESSFHERHAVKQAGFWWHGGNCRPGCKACEAGLGKVWWTPKVEAASRLSEYADDGAKAAMAGHLEEVAASHANDAEIDVPVPSGLDYLPFQRAGISYAMRRPSTLIADEMGLGKTIQALGTVNADESTKNVLVMCPASLRLNWLREAQRWLVRPFKFHVVESAEAVPSDANFVVCNYDRLVGRKTQVVFESLMGREWDVLIADESHYVKNPKAQRTKAMLGAKAKKATKKTKAQEAKDGLIARARRRLFLTGTPILNRPIEIHPLLAALDPDRFGNFFGFAKRYCQAQRVYIGRNRYAWDFSGASNLSELQERLRGSLMVRRLKKDVLSEMPSKRRQLVPLPQNGAAKAVAAEQAAYAKHAEKIAELEQEAELAEAAGDQEAYRHAVARLTKCRQLAFTEMSQERQDVALAKAPKVIEHLDAMFEEGVQKIILFAHHKAVIKAFQAHLGDKAVTVVGDTPNEERQEAVDRFQSDPNCQVFIGSIKAAGVGLTLTAASNVVFAELDWTPGWMVQAEDRAHRIGQTESVLVQYLVFDGSIDARIAQMLVDKQGIADSALDDSTKVTVSEQAQEADRADRERRQAQMRKFPAATEAEREAAMTGIRMLAGVCDGAVQEDGRGFSKLDTAAGHKLAARSAQRPFTDGEVAFAKRLLTKYRRQIPPDLLAVVGISS